MGGGGVEAGAAQIIYSIIIIINNNDNNNNNYDFKIFETGATAWAAGASKLEPRDVVAVLAGLERLHPDLKARSLYIYI